MAHSLLGWLKALFNLILGVALGVVVVEVVLRLNPHLLLRGMAAPAPIDVPLTLTHYTVRYSDADVFYWHAALIQPMSPQADQVEAEVQFETDEFGFPNPAPLPRQADVVVLGRSYALGAQAANPWPRQLTEQTSWQVVNLSQPASGLALKHDYLKRFGLPRHPRWIIIEVLPSLDILGYDSKPPTGLTTSLPFPIAQHLARQIMPALPASTVTPIYPLTINLPQHTLPLTFYSHYLAEATISAEMLEASTDWANYRNDLLRLIVEAEAQSACVALLFAPTNVNVYLPLLVDPTQIEPALSHVAGWQLTTEGNLIQGAPPTAAQTLPANALAARDMVARWARAQNLTFIDPTASMTQSALSGVSPFMVYDTHWSATGHNLVAEAVASTLATAVCP